MKHEIVIHSLTGKSTGKPNAEFNRLRMLFALIRHPGGETASKLASFGKIPGGRAKDILNALVKSGNVEKISIVKPSGANDPRPYPAYRLLESPMPADKIEEFIKSRKAFSSYKTSDNDKDRMCDMYAAGKPIAQLAREFGLVASAVLKILKSRGARIRPMKEERRRCSVNHAAFSKLTQESAYWMGFLMADGCVHGKKKCSNVIRLQLAEKDRDHIFKYREFLQSTHSVIETKGLDDLSKLVKHRTKSYSLAVASDGIAADLARAGVTHRKTYSAKVLDDRLLFDRHFWRGMIDGDGWVTCGIKSNPRRMQIGLVGTREIVGQFRDFAMTICGKSKAAIVRRGNICSMTFVGSFAKALATVIYDDCHVYLERKYANAHKIMRGESNYPTARR